MFKQTLASVGLVGLISLWSVGAFAASETVVYSFSATGLTDGTSPHGTLLDVAGQLFGVTTEGGNNRCAYDLGCGVIFKTTLGGEESIVHKLQGGRNSITPYPNDISYQAGTFYGTTCCGRAIREGQGFRGGTAFKFGPFGQMTLLHVFGRGKDGSIPRGKLTFLNGILYGLTQDGGQYGNGTVFSLTPDGRETVVHSFAGGEDGSAPEAGLIAAHGILYGTTGGGGHAHAGTVFSIAPSGDEKVIYAFRGDADGALPLASLIEVDGALYGTTYQGGNKRCSGSGCGTVFKVTLAGTETVLHTFVAGADDGALPQNELLYTSGILYGVTAYGGNNRGCIGAGFGCGTVFEIDGSGEFSLLRRFQDGANDGIIPYGGLVSVGGALYGVTLQGGTSDSGTIYGIVP